MGNFTMEIDKNHQLLQTNGWDQEMEIYHNLITDFDKNSYMDKESKIQILSEIRDMLKIICEKIVK